MFTGIIEEIGRIEKVQQSAMTRLTVSADVILADVKVGDSINVNGVCLTIVKKEAGKLTFEVMGQTKDETTFKSISKGDKVNLERAMTSGGRFGGHIVSGHIDGVGEIERREDKKDETRLTIKADRNIILYLVSRGSVAVDGVSLTVACVNRDSFTVCLIPHTLKNTVLGFKKNKDKVNLEADILSKYAAVHLNKQQGTDARDSKITEVYLKKMGFG
ncbi:MAG: riboflavin synthase [Candidatus Omnitrophica bacterium]|nr:riboflavin synthase [Candidatus Omnitrophota bacterium]MBU1925843.1 riboflavin synthase [Candidatus Omnitrophota bacterium]